MHILAIAEVHGNSNALAKNTGQATQADLVLIIDDLTDFGGMLEAQILLSIIDDAKGKIVAVPGNCDRTGVIDLRAIEGISADGHGVGAGGAKVIGAGGRWAFFDAFLRLR